MQPRGGPRSCAARRGRARGRLPYDAVLLTDGTATAQGSDYLYDIVSALGGESGTAAATGGGWLAELLSLS